MAKTAKFTTGAITLLLILACFLTGRIPKVTSDVRTLFPESSPELTAFEKTNEEFGNQIFDSVVIKYSEDLDVVDDLHTLEEELVMLPGVKQVISPLVSSSLGLNLETPDKSFARFILMIDGQLGQDERHELNGRIDQLLKGFEHLEPSRAGAFFISESVFSVINGESLIRTGLTLGLLALSSFFMLGSIKKSLCVLASPLLGVSWVSLTAALLGYSLGPISQLFPPFVLAVGAAYSIHVMVRVSTSGRACLPELGSAIFTASTTTAVGLLSLLALGIQGVSEFAVMASVGTVLCAVLSLVVTPTLVSETKRSKVLDWPLASSLFKKRLLSFFTLAASFIVGFGILNVKIHTDPLMFIPKGSSYYSQVDNASSHFPGTKALSVVFAKSSNKLSEAELQEIESLATRLEALPDIFSTITDLDFKPRKEVQIFSDSHYAPSFITTHKLDKTRIIAETNLEGIPLLELKKQVLEIVGSSNLEVSVSGLELVMSEQNTAIVKGIINSLFFTLLVFAVFIFYYVRNLAVTIIGLVPNILPIVVVFGAIGWIYQDISLGASLVAATSLSIAVDNTFHYLLTWNASDKNSEKTIRTLFPSFITSTVVLVTGFSAMAASEVLPVQQFGLLMILTLTIGLFADTIVLPFLTSLLPGKR